MTTLRERLERAMKAAGIPSQRQLAFRANLRPATITRWVQGETRAIHPNDLAPVAQALGVQAEWLLTGRGPMQAMGAAEAPQPYREEPPAWSELTPAQRVVATALLASLSQVPDAALAGWFEAWSAARPAPAKRRTRKS